MKNYCTLILAILWLTSVHSQCFEPIAVDWNIDGSYLLTIESLDDGTVYYPDGSTQAVTNGDLLYYTDGTNGQINSLLWTLLPTGGGGCQYQFDVNVNTFINSYHINTTSPTICGGNDGQICVDLPGYNPISFSVPININSIDGCVTGLSPQAYYLTFDNFTEGGIEYSNPSREVKIYSLEVQLVDDGTGTLVGFATGGTEPYTYTYNTQPLATYTNYQAGCFHVQVNDFNDCSASNISYYSPTIAGDLGNTDNCVNSSDLLEFLSDLGVTYDVNHFGNTYTQSDFNCDGIVNVADLLFLLSVFGNCCSSC